MNTKTSTLFFSLTLLSTAFACEPDRANKIDATETGYQEQQRSEASERALRAGFKRMTCRERKKIYKFKSRQARRAAKRDKLTEILTNLYEDNLPEKP